MHQASLPLLFNDHLIVEEKAGPVGNRRPLKSTEDLGFDLVIKRSPKRRTMEIIVKGHQVRLMLPQFVATAEGMAFVELKRDWILDTLEKHRQHQAEIVERQYTDGALFSYLGHEYPLRIYLGTKTSVQLVNDSIYIAIQKRHAGNSAKKSDAVQRALWQWYQAQAQRVLTQKVNALTQKINRPYQAIQLRRTKTKWGHCTRDGVIQFNWQILCAPEPVIDYLVAHEVSHLVHHNHGVRFWRHVEKLFPDYKPHQRWLRDNEHRLTV